jgi:serine/threonine-protein kinase Chk2
VEKGGNEDRDASKKPRRSERLSQSQAVPSSPKQQSPSPVAHQESTSSSEIYKEATATPPEGRPSQLHHHELNDRQGFSSPPQDTQAFSQFAYPVTTLSEEVKDEMEEGVWGYLLPMDQKYGKSLVMRKRNACPVPDSSELSSTRNAGGKKSKSGKTDLLKEEDAYEQTKFKGIASGGYLIGRHPECGMPNTHVQNGKC